MQTLQTGVLGNVFKFSDGRMFKEENHIFDEVYELDFFVPRPYDKLRTLIRYLSECYNDTSINNVFQVDMGAQAVKTVLNSLELDKLSVELREEIIKAKKQKRMKLIKRLTVVESFRKSKNKPEWMVLDVIPVLPPDIRPMVQLEGGRFASSDLNDLYRRVINRNNRLKKLIEIKAPESIIRNEKRMLQEAVDALIDNGRRGRVFTGSHKRPLKSLSELLKGKQGRFRQNLLGKRVDYSGRSVIVVGPELKLHQCGLPKEMALELFKPFVMHELVKRGVVPNIKSAKKVVERADNEVWDVLEEIVQDHPVLLNRAPTLHRLGIQAFQPVLIEGKAIQIHPLVCAAFNADFDGDQMAVHLPLSLEAQAEARLIMLSTNNLLLPSNGRPVVAPSQDIVIGVYYLTLDKPGSKGEGKLFRNVDEINTAYELGYVSLHAKIKIRLNGEILETTVGRVIFNNVLPTGWPFEMGVINKKQLSRIIGACLRRYGQHRTVRLLDEVKALGYKFATRSGLTISIDDVVIPPERDALLKEGDKIEKEIDEYYDRGLLTEDERYQRRVELWQDRTEKMMQVFNKIFEEQRFNSLYMMAKSGARGTPQQIRQLAGLRGLMNDPTGRTIDFPIKTNFREGLTVLEYFISTHGARKGLADTALRTADSGYLTRRLVDVAQDVIVQELDCGTNRYLPVESVYVNGVDTPLSHEIKIKDLPVTKKAPVEIRAAKVYEFPEIAEIYPTIKVKGKQKKVFLKKIFPVRDEFRQVVGVKKDSKSQLVDMIGIDFTILTNHVKELIGEKIIGRVAARDVFSLTTGEVFVAKGEEITEEDYENVKKSLISAPLQIRSTLECATRFGVCAMCYGRNFATGKVAQIGDAAGIIAAQSIGEPGTQLTMRTFHTGGVSSEDIADITQGLPRVEELFEARKPKSQALMSELDGKVEIVSSETGRELVITPQSTKDGAKKIRLKVADDAMMIVKNGDRVTMGQALTDGHLNPHEVLSVMGLSKAQEHLVNEVIAVYKSQGVDTNEKHVEVIVREMLRKIRIETAGDTEFLPQSLVDRFEFDRVNREMRLRGKKPASGKSIMLGITKCSLSTNSFLSAASFQETTRVLTDAAVKGKVDPLMGLKENVIIGNLIPAGTGLPPYRDLKLAFNPPEGLDLDDRDDIEAHLEPLTKEGVDASVFNAEGIDEEIEKVFEES
ncbi:MAG: DNA-directed RNA polymerase subunit beta' [bacterium]